MAESDDDAAAARSTTEGTDEVTTPTSPRAARSRAKILAAATELLVESGARSVTVDAVEAASGVAKSTLYRHFASRDELLVSVVQSCLPQTVQPDMDEGFEPALRHLMAVAAESFADPQWARVFPAVLSLRATMPELGAFIDADKADRHRELERVLDLGVAEGTLSDGIDIDTAVNLLVGPLVLAAITPDDAVDPSAMSALADVVVDSFIASFGI